MDLYDIAMQIKEALDELSHHDYVMFEGQLVSVENSATIKRLDALYQELWTMDSRIPANSWVMYGWIDVWIED